VITPHGLVMWLRRATIFGDLMSAHLGCGRVRMADLTPVFAFGCGRVRMADLTPVFVLAVVVCEWQT
jgi:hypothetical protein